jgi:hypothetical protein
MRYARRFMKSLFGRYAGTFGVVAALCGGLVARSPAAMAAQPAESSSLAEQNLIVQRHCAVCHNDSARNGGLSLQYFDTTQAAPSLAAMMLSKLTSGLPLDVVRSAATDATAAALVNRKLKDGAINAAGLQVADMRPIRALAAALAIQTSGASEWHVTDGHGATPTMTASILRELPVARRTGETALYRLSVSCNAATGDGEMQLAWAPVPQTGTLSVAVDDKAPLTYKVEGSEKMGDGSKATPTGPAAINLHEPTRDSRTPRMPLPVRSLTISNLFPDESVVFPFSGLTEATRQRLSACFVGTSRTQ